MERFLEREGYQLLAARNAEEAIAVADVYGKRIHLLVTDMEMAGIGGQELAAKMARAHPLMKVLYVSGYRHHVREPAEDPAENILAKPFPAVEMLRRVALLLHDGRAARA